MGVINSMPATKLARILSGTILDKNYKTDKAYKSALRQVYLYREGKRKPGRKYKAAIDRLDNKTRGRVRYSGLVTFSSDTRRRTLQWDLDPEQYVAWTMADGYNQIEIFGDNYGTGYFGFDGSVAYEDI